MIECLECTNKLMPPTNQDLQPFMERLDWQWRGNNGYGVCPDCVPGVSVPPQVESLKKADIYSEFLQSKRLTVQESGFDVAELNSMLFPFQTDLTRHALQLGKSALFADCGLGKTVIQLEWANQVYQHTNQSVLILAPLAVSAQTQREGVKFNIPVTICKTGADVQPGINITNYQRLHHFNPGDFGGIVLDESSILKAFTGKIRKQITEFATYILYKLCCTATPAPNDLIELLNHAEFLDIMSGKEVIALFFTQDGNTTQKWRLKGHAREEFWSWMSEWSVAMRQPSDLGYKDDSFVLPGMEIHKHIIDGIIPEGYLFEVAALDLSDQRRARNASIQQRCEMIAKRVSKLDEPFIIWCNLNKESEILAKLIPNAVEVRGSQTLEYKEQALIDFSVGNVQGIITKPTIAGHGMNWQHCAYQEFCGFGHSFEQFYQAVRRSHRFGQERKVHIHITVARANEGIIDNVERKEAQATEMFNEIVKRMSITSAVKADEKIHRKEMVYKVGENKGRDWTMYLGDCVEQLAQVEDESVGLTVTSPPFPGMYIYTNSPHDMGNSVDMIEMLEHFRFLVNKDNLLRVTMPGRSVAIHLTQLTKMKSREGHMGLRDFRGKTIELMEEEGWHWTGEACISVNPQMQAIRNKEHQLLFKSLAKDSAIMRPALPDWLLKFTKPGDNPEPIRAGLSKRYNNPDGWISEEDWILWADGIWWADDLVKEQLGEFDVSGLVNYLTWAYYKTSNKNIGIDGNATQGQTIERRPRDLVGIRRTDVLNVKQARETDDERHLCPLQLGVIERAIKMWSAPGDLILDPFTGVGSTGWKALELGRGFVGMELKESYYLSAIRNLREAETKGRQVDLFDFAGVDT